MLSPQEMGLLAQTQLMKGCTLEQCEEMRSLWNSKKSAANVTLMSVGQPGEVLYVVIKGTVRISIDGHNGIEVVLGLRGPGELIGEASMLDDLPRSATATTAEPCQLFWIAKRDLQTQLETIPLLSLNIARSVARRQRVLTSQIRAFCSLDVRGRVACQLLAIADHIGQELENGAILLPIHITQGDLGAMIGANRVSVNHVFASWKKRGLIEVDKSNRIVIIQSALLEKEMLYSGSE